MADQAASDESGTTRRAFLQRMARAGLIGAPVVASFSLFGPCEHEFPDWGGNQTKH